MTERTEPNQQKTMRVGLWENKWLVLGIVCGLFLVGIASGVQRLALSLQVKSSTSVEDYLKQVIFLQVAFTLLGYGLFKSLSDLAAGWTNERFGRKWIMIVGISIVFIGNIPMAILPLIDYPDTLVLLVGNAFIGAGQGLFFASAVTALSDLGGHKQRAMASSLHEFCVYGGYSIGSIITGLISNPNDFTNSFLFALSISFVAGILGHLILKETKQFGNIIEEVVATVENEEMDPIPKQIQWYLSKGLNNPTVILSYLSGHSNRIADSLIILFLPFLLIEKHGLSLVEIGLVTSTFTIALAIFMPIFGRISDKVGRRMPITLGLALQGLMILLFPIVDTWFLLILVALLAGTGVALYFPILPSISIDIAPQKYKAKTVGIYRFFSDLGYFTGPLIIGFIASAIFFLFSTGGAIQALSWTFYIVAALLILVSISVLLFQKETRPEWTQFTQAFEHAKLTNEITQSSCYGIIAYIEDFSEDIKSLAVIAKKKEREADRKLAKISTVMYSSPRQAQDDAEFLRLARRLDYAAGLSLGALIRLRRVDKECIPQTMQLNLKKTAMFLSSLMETTVIALETLDINVFQTKPHLVSARKLEQKLDYLYGKMAQELFRKADEGTIGVGTVLMLKEVIDMLELAADTIEEAGETIRILGIKYRA